MKDTLDPFLSAYSGVHWSAPDEDTIEGEFQLVPLRLRQIKAQRRLCVRLSEISAHEFWEGMAGEAAARPERKLTGRGALSEVLTVFELAGGPIRQFRQVEKITITAKPAEADHGHERHNDPNRARTAGSQGVLFIDFEALKVHGEHQEPALNLNITMDVTEFQRKYALLDERPDDVKSVTLILDADLFGEEFEQGACLCGEPQEYGMLRPSDAPLIYAPVRLERIEVKRERSKNLGDEVAVSEHSPQHLPMNSQLNHESTLVVRRLGWVIALLVVVILILLSGLEWTTGAALPPRQFAENTLYIVSGVPITP